MDYIDFPITKLIQCNDINVAAFCEAENNKKVTIYYPSTVLIYVEQGQLHITHGDQTFTIRSGNFGLVKKFTRATYHKTFTESEGSAKTYGFAMSDVFLRKVIKDVHIPSSHISNDCFFHLKINPLLSGLMNSIITYMENDWDLDPDILELKTKEALIAIVRSNPKLAPLFREYSLPEKADIYQFMNSCYLINIPLRSMAHQSGRSLSTFQREFKKVFHETPHKWIMKKRLDQAKKLLAEGKGTPSEIYLQVGFEDLAHFSKAFKKQFRISPSEIHIL